jgi:hypothetical protein
VHILDSVLLGLLVCALINVPLVLRAKRLRRLSEAKLGIIRVISQFERKLLDGTVKNGDACHDVLFKNMSKIEYRERYSVRWNPFRFPSKEEIEFHAMLDTELKSNDEAARLLREFSQWYSRAYRTSHPFISLFFAIWVFCWGTSLRVVLFGLIGLIFSILGISKMLKNYRELKSNLDGWLLAKTFRTA